MTPHHLCEAPVSSWAVEAGCPLGPWKEAAQTQASFSLLGDLRFGYVCLFFHFNNTKECLINNLSFEKLLFIEAFNNMVKKILSKLLVIFPVY